MLLAELAIRRRERTPRNLAAKRAVGVLLEQLGQLLAHTVRHHAFDWSLLYLKSRSNTSLIAATRTASLSADLLVG